MYPNPQDFYNRLNGKSVDVDGAYGAQCWDLFAYFCNKEKLDVNTYCNLTGYAGDLYKERYKKNYDKYFEFFFPKHAQRGDWIFWDQHVAMVWSVDIYKDEVYCLGQNQGGIKKVTLKSYKLSSALGCMRYIPWIKKEGAVNGWKKENGSWYYYVDNKKVTGWHKLKWSKGENWFYFDPEGKMAENGLYFLKWSKGNNWFLFDKNGCMATQATKMTLNFDKNGCLKGGKAE